MPNIRSQVGNVEVNYLTAAVGNLTVSLLASGLSIALSKGSGIYFKLNIMFSLAGTTSGYKFAFTGLSTLTLTGYQFKVIDTATNAIVQCGVENNQATISGNLANAGNHILEVEGIIIANAAGTFGLEFAQNTLDASNAIQILGASSITGVRL